MEPIISIAKCVAQIVQAIPPEKLACVNNATLVDVYLEQLREGNLSGRTIDLFAILKSYLASTGSDNLITPELVEYNEKLRRLEQGNQSLEKKLTQLESAKLLDRLEELESRNCVQQLPQDFEYRLSQLEEKNKQVQNFNAQPKTLTQLPQTVEDRIKRLEDGVRKITTDSENKMDCQEQNENVEITNILIQNLELARNTLIKVEQTIAESNTLIIKNTTTINQNTTIINNFDKNLDSVKSTVSKTAADAKDAENKLVKVQQSVDDLIEQLKKTRRDGNSDEDGGGGAAALVNTVVLNKEVRELVERVVEQRYRNDLTEYTQSHQTETATQRDLVQKFRDEIEAGIVERETALNENYTKAINTITSVQGEVKAASDRITAITTDFSTLGSSVEKIRRNTTTQLNTIASLVGIDILNGTIITNGNLGTSVNAVAKVEELLDDYNSLSEQISKARSYLQQSLRTEIDEYNGVRRQTLDELAEVGAQIDDYAKTIGNILSELKVLRDTEESEIDSTPLLNVRRTIDEVNNLPSNVEPQVLQVTNTVASNSVAQNTIPQNSVVKNTVAQNTAVVNAIAKNNISNAQVNAASGQVRTGGTTFTQQRLARVQALSVQQAQQVGAQARLRPQTQPTVTQPTVTQPTVTQPTVTQPTVTQPTVTQPALASGNAQMQVDTSLQGGSTAAITSSRSISEKYSSRGSTRLGSKNTVGGRIAPLLGNKKYTERGLSAAEALRVTRANRVSNLNQATVPDDDDDYLNQPLGDDDDDDMDDFFEAESDMNADEPMPQSSTSTTTAGIPPAALINILSPSLQKLGRRTDSTTESNADEGPGLDTSLERSQNIVIQ
jgi:hypothetical protein